MNFNVDNKTWEAIFGLEDNNNRKDVRKKYIDFPHILADLKTKLCIGNGYEFTTENEELKEFWEKMVKNSKLREKINIALYQIFFHGKIILGFDKLDDNFFVYVADNTFKPHIVKVYEKIVSVVLRKKTIISTNHQLHIHEFWNMEKVIRWFYFDKIKISNWGIETEVPKDLQLPLEEPNPFQKWDLIPFQDFNNNFHNASPDWWGVKNYFDIFNKKIEHLIHELKLNVSRLVLNVTKEQMKEIEKKIKEGKDIDYIINVPGSPVSEKLPVEIISSTIRLGEIKSAITETIKEIFSLSGYTMNNGSVDNATATEIAVNNSLFHKNIILSQMAFNENFTLLLDKIFKVAGFENIDYTFALTENTNFSQEELINNTVQMFVNGFINQIDAIALVRNLDTAEAKLKAEEIVEETEKRMELEQKMEAKNETSIGKTTDATSAKPSKQ